MLCCRICASLYSIRPPSLLILTLCCAICEAESGAALRCRVCARYTGHAQVTLKGITLTDSPAGNYDSTLVCHDFSYLPSGLLPITVQYASDPTDVNNAFQFWIIPVKGVTEVANPVRRSLCSHICMLSAAQTRESSCLLLTTITCRMTLSHEKDREVQSGREKAL